MRGAERNRMLDILRIAAMFMVLLVHIPIYVKLPVTFPNGQYGVAVFFVISGFLIMESLERESNLFKFYKKRLLRILPEYYLILLAGVIIWDKLLGQMPSDGLLHIGWIRYFLCLNTVLPSDNYYYWNDLWGLWTISCFMFFYLVAPIIKKWSKNFYSSLVGLGLSVVFGYVIKKIVVICLAQSGADSVEMFAGDTPVFNLMFFLLGVCAWYAQREKKTQQYLSLCTALFVVCLFLGRNNRMTWGLLTVIVLLMGKDISIKSGIVNKIIDVVSAYSFTIYLVHFPVFQILKYTLGDKLGNCMYVVVSFTLIIVIAIATHKLSEILIARCQSTRR